MHDDIINASAIRECNFAVEKLYISFYDFNIFRASPQSLPGMLMFLPQRLYHHVLRLTDGLN